MAKRKRTSSRPRRTKRSRVSRPRRIPRLPNIIPASKIVKHRYVDTVVLDPNVSVPYSYVFRANSVFDPDYTSTGHQPLGFDQWKVFYDHYNVIGSKITATFITEASNGAVACAHVGIILTDSVTAIPNTSLIMEQGTSRYTLVTSANAQQVSRPVKAFYSPKKFFGIKDIGDNRNMLGAPMNNNPPEDAYFQVYAAPLTSELDVFMLRAVVTIEYLVQYTERKPLLQS